MHAIDTIKNAFAKVAHVFGYYDERSRTTRVTGIEPFAGLSDEKPVTKPTSVSYSLKLYPALDGGKAQLALLVEGANIGVPRWMVAARTTPREESYCHVVPLCKIRMEQGREMIANFDAGERMDFFLPYDAFDHSLVNAVCDGEEKFGVKPPVGEHKKIWEAHRNFREHGYK